MSEEKAPYGKQDSPFAKHILEILRQRRGLKADDPSEDDWLRKYSSRHALDEVCAFVLGHSEWVDQFLGWLDAVGYLIVPKKEIAVKIEKTVMEIFIEEVENKKRKLDRDLTWEIGRNEHAKRDLKLLLNEIVRGWEGCEHKTIITSELKSIISCLEKPRPKD